MGMFELRTDMFDVENKYIWCCYTKVHVFSLQGTFDGSKVCVWCIGIIVGASKYQIGSWTHLLEEI